MRLTLEIHFDSQWHQAATLDLKDEAYGYQGAPSEILKRAMGRCSEISDCVLATCL